LLRHLFLLTLAAMSMRFQRLTVAFVICSRRGISSAVRPGYCAIIALRLLLL
jgi:hypothetical protein